MAYRQKGFQSGNGKTHGKMTGDPVPSDSTNTSTPKVITISGETIINGQRREYTDEDKAARARISTVLAGIDSPEFRTTINKTVLDQLGNGKSLTQIANALEATMARLNEK